MAVCLGESENHYYPRKILTLEKYLAALNNLQMFEKPYYTINQSVNLCMDTKDVKQFHIEIIRLIKCMHLKLASTELNWLIHMNVDLKINKKIIVTNKRKY